MYNSFVKHLRCLKICTTSLAAKYFLSPIRATHEGEAGTIYHQQRFYNGSERQNLETIFSLPPCYILQQLLIS